MKPDLSGITLFEDRVFMALLYRMHVESRGVAEKIRTRKALEAAMQKVSAP